MADTNVDRNLLFAVIALQNNFIDQADLIAAFHSWSADQVEAAWFGCSSHAELARRKSTGWSRCW